MTGPPGDGEEAPDAGAPERRRPLGGAAAWRRDPVQPVRAADDERREAQRYRRAPLVEQLRGAVVGFGRNRALVAIVAVIVGGFVVLRLLTPEVVPFAELAPGDCLYVRAGDPDAGPAIGGPSSVRSRLLEAGAERAPCQLSHSHEVAGIVELPDGPWPGETALLAVVEAPCRSTVATYVGRRPDAAQLALHVIAPDEVRWSEGLRRVACLVHRADGGFLPG